MVQAQIAESENVSATQLVVEAVADADDVAPEELTPPLYDAIDPDALDRLFAAVPPADQTNRRIDFAYKDYRVSVSGTGSVSIQLREEDDRLL
jgi:hypothetical protein